MKILTCWVLVIFVLEHKYLKTVWSFQVFVRWEQSSICSRAHFPQFWGKTLLSIQCPMDCEAFSSGLVGAGSNASLVGLQGLLPLNLSPMLGILPHVLCWQIHCWVLEGHPLQISGVPLFSVCLLGLLPWEPQLPSSSWTCNSYLLNSSLVGSAWVSPSGISV